MVRLIHADAMLMLNVSVWMGKVMLGSDLIGVVPFRIKGKLDTKYKALR